VPIPQFRGNLVLVAFSFVLWFCSSLSRERERERWPRTRRETERGSRTLSSLENLSWIHRNPWLHSYHIGTDSGWPPASSSNLCFFIPYLLLFQSLKRMYMDGCGRKTYFQIFRCRRKSYSFTLNWRQHYSILATEK
jgi:hypothetical protein